MLYTLGMDISVRTDVHYGAKEEMKKRTVQRLLVISDYLGGRLFKLAGEALQANLTNEWDIATNERKTKTFNNLERLRNITIDALITEGYATNFSSVEMNYTQYCTPLNEMGQKEIKSFEIDQYAFESMLPEHTLWACEGRDTPLFKPSFHTALEKLYQDELIRHKNNLPAPTPN